MGVRIQFEVCLTDAAVRTVAGRGLNLPDIATAAIKDRIKLEDEISALVASVDPAYQNAKLRRDLADAREKIRKLTGEIPLYVPLHR